MDPPAKPEDLPEPTTAEVSQNPLTSPPAPTPSIPPPPPTQSLQSSTKEVSDSANQPPTNPNPTTNNPPSESQPPTDNTESANSINPTEAPTAVSTSQPSQIPSAQEQVTPPTNQPLNGNESTNAPNGEQFINTLNQPISEGNQSLPLNGLLQQQQQEFDPNYRMPP